MSALICGSLAYDTIMVFQDQFKKHILPDQVHILNVSFLVPRMRREFGGCAGNIAYNLHLLGGDPIPMGTVGSDFGPYREHFDALDRLGGRHRHFDPQHTAGDQGLRDVRKHFFRRRANDCDHAAVSDLLEILLFGFRHAGKSIT